MELFQFSLNLVILSFCFFSFSFFISSFLKIEVWTKWMELLSLNLFTLGFPFFE